MKTNVDCLMCTSSGIDITDAFKNPTCKSSNLEHQYNFKDEGKYCATHCNGFRLIAEINKGEVKNSDRAKDINRIIKEKIVSNVDALSFILAGKSEFTIQSERTGKCFSFRLDKQKSTSKYENSSEFIYFLNVVKNDKTMYAGLIIYNTESDLFEFRRGNKGKLDSSDIRVKSLLFIVNNLHTKNYNVPVTIFHCGKCGKCGKKLTTPKSILTGLGPSCAKNAGIPMAKI